LRGVVSKIKGKNGHDYRIRLNEGFRLCTREEYSLIINEAIRIAFPDFKFPEQ
jgi:hypothetical protein